MTTTALTEVWWPLLWNSGALPMAILTADHRYHHVNKALCSALGSDEKTLLSWSYEQIGHPLDLDAELDAFVRLELGATTVSYQRHFRRQNHEDWIALVHLIAAPSDRFLQIIIPGGEKNTAPDLSANKLQAIASALSHDAQEPVRMLGVAAGLLEQRLGPLVQSSERDQQIIQSMEQNAVRLNKQMRALVRYARLGPPTIDPTPRAVFGIVEKAIAQVEFPTTVTVKNSTPADLLLACDHDQLTTAISELLRNAAAPHAVNKPTHITVTAHQHEHQCAITIHDDGVGISALDIPRLGRLFVARGPGAGAGVGLAIVHAIAEAHGGNVHITSTLGVETAVTVSIPS